jgi:putative polyhydroxyalkanoate system protein
MSTIRMERQHTLGEAKAREAASAVAERLKEKMQIAYRWEGNVLRFERSGAKGQLHVSDSQVRMEIELGLMLRPMKGMIEQKMADYFDRYFSG